jgi:hypothetical protein
MTADEAMREAQKWLDYLEAQKARADKLQKLARLAKTDPKEAQHQMRQMDEQPHLYDGAKLADGLRVMIAEIERLEKSRNMHWLNALRKDTEIERLTTALRQINCSCITPRPGVMDAVKEISREALAKED